MSRLSRSVYCCRAAQHSFIVWQKEVGRGYGIGSVSQAMAASIPQLIRPQAHDQFDNAQRIELLGIGLSLKPDRFNDASLVKALNQLLGSQERIENCKKVSGRIVRERGVTQACDHIETVASR